MSVEFRFDELQLINKIDLFAQRLRSYKIGTDIDGVEVDSAGNALKLLNDDYKTNYKPDDLIRYWSAVDLIKRDFIDVDDPAKFAMDLWNSDRNLGEANPISGSLLLSSYLNRLGVNEIHRITSRPSFTKPITLDWYKRKMPWIDQSLIHMQDEGTEISHNFKIDKINELGIEIFFEDSWEHAEAISEGTNATTVLVPQPWNYDYLPKSGSRIIKVSESKYRTAPKMIKTYFQLADLI